MTLHDLTVQVEAESPQAARLLAAQAGFTVKRVARPKVVATITAAHPFIRASAVLDMPSDLSRDERKAYVKGYAAGCMTFVKKHGIPRGDDLVAATKEAEWERHPVAHRKGLLELAAWRTRTAAFLADRSATVVQPLKRSA